MRAACLRVGQLLNQTELSRIARLDRAEYGRKPRAGLAPARITVRPRTACIHGGLSRYFSARVGRCVPPRWAHSPAPIEPEPESLTCPSCLA